MKSTKCTLWYINIYNPVLNTNSYKTRDKGRNMLCQHDPMQYLKISKNFIPVF